VVKMVLADLHLPVAFDASNFHEVLRYCYTNDEEEQHPLVTPYNATRLLVAADAFLLADMKRLCEREIEELYLCAHNAEHLLELCQLQGGAAFAPRLVKACEAVILSKQKDRQGPE
jgi:hypothetical protein